MQERSDNRARTLVRTYTSYADAQQAVDYLSDQGFPVQHVAIVAEGLRLVEQVVGRLDLGRAALAGAINGALVGALFGLILGLFAGPGDGLALALYGLVFGALVGAVMGAVVHALTRGRRDFVATSGFQADRYQLMVDDEFAARAASVLAGMAGAQAATRDGRT